MNYEDNKKFLDLVCEHAFSEDVKSFAASCLTQFDLVGKNTTEVKSVKSEVDLVESYAKEIVAHESPAFISSPDKNIIDKLINNQSIKEDLVEDFSQALEGSINENNSLFIPSGNDCSPPLNETFRLDNQEYFKKVISNITDKQTFSDLDQSCSIANISDLSEDNLDTLARVIVLGYASNNINYKHMDDLMNLAKKLDVPQELILVQDESNQPLSSFLLDQNNNLLVDLISCSKDISLDIKSIKNILDELKYRLDNFSNLQTEAKTLIEKYEGALKSVIPTNNASGITPSYKKDKQNELFNNHTISGYIQMIQSIKDRYLPQEEESDDVVANREEVDSIFEKLSQVDKQLSFNFQPTTNSASSCDPLPFEDKLIEDPLYCYINLFPKMQSEF